MPIPAAAALLALWLAGCDYEYPNGKPTGQPMDPRLLGHWRQVDDKPTEKVTYMTVTRLSADRFAVQHDGDAYEAYGIDFPAARPQIVELQCVDAKGGKPGAGKNYLYTIFKIEGNGLTVARLAPTKDLVLHSTAEQQAYLGRMLKTDQPYGQMLKFVPATAEEAARAQKKSAPSADPNEALAEEILPSRQGGYSNSGAAPRKAPTKEEELNILFPRNAVPPAKPAKPAPSPKTIPPAAKDAPPQLRAGGPPQYPEALRRAGITGRVVVEFTVTTDGRVADAKVVESSHREFEQPALDAVQQWIYLPGTKAGRPGPVRLRQELQFAQKP
jgi:TonB family protein